MTFNVGDTVKSQPIGSKESFVGTIVEVLKNYNNRNVYNIRDAYNLRWQRDEWDLEAAT